MKMLHAVGVQSPKKRLNKANHNSGNNQSCPQLMRESVSLFNSIRLREKNQHKIPKNETSTTCLGEVSQTMHSQPQHIDLNISVQKLHQYQDSKKKENDIMIQKQDSPIKINPNMLDIQAHLTRENENLKQHRDFLINEIRKINKRLKAEKEINEYLKCEYEKSQTERVVFQQENLQLKLIMIQCANKIKGNDQIRQVLTTVVQRSMERQQKKGNEDLMQILQQIPLQKNDSLKYSSQFIRGQQNNLLTIPEHKNKLLQLKDSQLLFSQQQSDHEMKLNTIEAQIIQLNKQFEALMLQFKKTRNIDKRRQCIEIAKKIKELKAQQNIENLNVFYQDKNMKTSSPLPQSPEYLQSDQNSKQHFCKMLHKMPPKSPKIKYQQKGF